MTNYPYHLSITSSVSPDYGVMQKGLTDSICILGFADAVDPANENKAYQVFNVNDALAAFTGSDAYDSTLIKGLIEAYTAGCKDIWLYPIANMDAYVPEDDRDSTFWTSLYNYYTDALVQLAESNDIDVLIPYDVDIEEGDFVELFADHCRDNSRGCLRLAYLPYNGVATNTFTGEDYHIVLVNGIGLFHYPDHFDVDYSASMVTSFAGLVSKLNPNVPPDNRQFRNPMLFSSDYEDSEETLEENSIVGFRKTIDYKRVHNGTLVPTLCYTRGGSSSDFRTLFAVHTVQRLLREIAGLDLIGSAAYLAEESLKEFFLNWIKRGYARKIDASFYYNAYELKVDLLIYLPYPVNDVSVSLIVGPVY